MFVSRSRLRPVLAGRCASSPSACAAPAPPAQRRRRQPPARTRAQKARAVVPELEQHRHDEGRLRRIHQPAFWPRSRGSSAVNVEAQPFVNFADVLNVRLSAKTPPNISWINASTGPLYVKSGKLVDLTPTINATPGFDLADFGDAALAPWKNGDKLVALPFTNASNVVFYNKDIFAKAGIPTPLELSTQGKWTWAAMRDTSKQLVDKQAAKYGLVLNNNIFTNGFRNLIDIYAPYGAAPWSDDGQTCSSTRRRRSRRRSSSGT